MSHSHARGSVTEELLFLDEGMSELKIKDYRLHNGSTMDHSNTTDDRPLRSTNSGPSIAKSLLLNY